MNAVLVYIHLFQYSEIFNYKLFRSLSESYQIIFLARSEDEFRSFMLRLSKAGYELKSGYVVKYFKELIDKTQIDRANRDQLDFAFEVENRVKMTLDRVIGSDRSYSQAKVDVEADYPKSILSQTQLKNAAIQILHSCKKVFNNYNISFSLISSGSLLANTIIAYLNSRDVKNYQVFFSRTMDLKEGMRFVSDNYLCENKVAIKKYNQLKSLNHDCSKESYSFIEEFKNRPRFFQPMDIHPKYIKRFRTILSLAIKGEEDSFLLGTSRCERIKSQISYMLKFRKQFDYFNNLKEDVGKNYVYIPLWQLPELTNLEWSPEYYSQLSFLENIRINTFSNLEIFTREHRFNIGRRSSNFYKKIESRAGMRWINPNNDPFSYISNAQAVVTVNGTTGWEGIIYKKPVFTFERTFFSVLGIAKQCNNYTDYRESFYNHVNSVNSANEIEYQKTICRYIDAERGSLYSPDEEGITNLINYLKADSCKENKKYSFWERANLAMI